MVVSVRVAWTATELALSQLTNVNRVATHHQKQNVVRKINSA
jgi:hypothetical protein